MQPLISVYIPTCNRRYLLERAVQSVLTQTYSNIEIIISDDRSDDDTQYFCKGLIEKYNNIIYLRNEIRSGACVARNKAIDVAKGKFITGLDDDDYFLPERLEFLLNELESNNYQVVFSDCKVIDEKGRVKVVEKKSVVKKRDLLKANYIGNQVFTYTRLLRLIGGFNINMPAWQDLECWFRLLSESDAHCIHHASYVVDMSHPHERITNSKVDKIQAAYNIFCFENNLKFREKAQLSTQLGPYFKRSAYNIKMLFLNLIFCNFISVGFSFRTLIKIVFLKIMNCKL
ncbi:glycosyltransferase [Aeromonas sp. V90_14]|uniref:glycosyltransferase n=1 Tax=Aeromonas sp. V90_14 TaxID=3044241 RepID=UPI00249E72A4|nr:glycosyltransferase [Aeromonas sp. V90_14]MDI3428900.1 glycosyltransferase [Aeromonas sp. V90_14]